MDDSALEKIRHGRIVKARVYDSSNLVPTEPHWGVVISSDAQIAASPRYVATMISSNTSIDPVYLVPVPAYIGLKGHFVCSWTPMIDEAGIVAVGALLLAPDLKKVLEMIRRYEADKAAKRRGDSGSS